MFLNKYLLLPAMLLLASCASNQANLSDYLNKPSECLTTSEPIEILIDKDLNNNEAEENSQQAENLLLEYNKIYKGKFVILNQWDDAVEEGASKTSTHFIIKEYSCDPDSIAKKNITDSLTKIFVTAGDVQKSSDPDNIASWHSPNAEGETFSVSYDNREESLGFFVTLKSRIETSIMFASVDANKPVQGRLKSVDKNKNLYAFYINNDVDGTNLIYSAMNGKNINITLRSDVATHKFSLNGFNDFILSHYK